MLLLTDNVKPDYLGYDPLGVDSAPVRTSVGPPYVLHLKIPLPDCRSDHTHSGIVDDPAILQGQWNGAIVKPCYLQWMNGRTDGYVDWCIYVAHGKWMDGWMDGWMEWISIRLRS